MVLQTTLERFNPGWPELYLDPYPVYDQYRAAEPVHWGLPTNPQLPGSWYTFRFDDCASALSDPRLKSDPASVGMADRYPPAFEPVAHVFQEWLGALDPPKHTRIRGVMAKTFTPRRMRELRPRIETIAEELLTAAIRTGRPFDLVDSFAFPLPMAVIGDMLGVPAADRDQFKELSTDFAKAIDQPGNPEVAAIGSKAAVEMLDYFKVLLDERRKQPTEDLITAMLQASTDDGETMTEFEILATAIELIVAGHETTVNTATKTTHGLLDQGMYADLAKTPEKINGNGMEELLRWASPLQRQRNRWVTEPMTLGGVDLKVGESVVVLLGAANRDPGQFETRIGWTSSAPPPGISPSASARTSAWARTWLAWKWVWRCRPCSDWLRTWS